MKVKNINFKGLIAVEGTHKEIDRVDLEMWNRSTTLIENPGNIRLRENFPLSSFRLICSGPYEDKFMVVIATGRNDVAAMDEFAQRGVLISSVQELAQRFKNIRPHSPQADLLIENFSFSKKIFEAIENKITAKSFIERFCKGILNSKNLEVFA